MYALTPVALRPVTSRVCPAPGPPKTRSVAPAGGNMRWRPAGGQSETLAPCGPPPSAATWPML